MPTYDYVCDACEHAFEEFQSMSAKPLKKCPACGKMKLRRLIGAGAGIIFKGSGFYETDYKRKSGSGGGSSDSGKNGESSSSDASTTSESSSSDSGSKSEKGEKGDSKESKTAAG
jgi:putative FmdB family regulatory protein